MAQQLLAQLGVTVADLHTRVGTVATELPTLGEYLNVVRAAAGPGANRTYGSYWDRMLALWGDRRLNEITATVTSESVAHLTSASPLCVRGYSSRGRGWVSRGDSPG